MKNLDYSGDSVRKFFEHNLLLIIPELRIRDFTPATDELDYVVDKLTESCLSGYNAENLGQFWSIRDGREIQRQLWSYLQADISATDYRRLGDQTLVFAGMVVFGFRRMLKLDNPTYGPFMGRFGKKNKVYTDDWYLQTGTKFYERALSLGTLPSSQRRLISRVAQDFHPWAMALSRISEEEFLAKKFGISR